MSGFGFGFGFSPLGALLNQNEPEVDTYISGLATPLSAGQVTKLNTFVKALKTGLGITNLSDAFDTIYLLAGETAESSLRNLAKNAHYAQAVNSPTFTALEGFTSNMSSSYINTNYNPSTEGVRFTQNSASFGVYSRSNADHLSVNDCGAVDGNNNGVSMTMRTTGATQQRLNSELGTHTVIADSLGLQIASRLNATTFKDYRNKSTMQTSPVNSAAPVNLNLYTLCRNSNGTAALFTVRQQALLFTARGISDAERDVIVDAVEAYMDSNGKGLIS